MPDAAKDTLSITDFKRHSAALIERMRDGQKPLALTVNGKVELVVQNAAAYRRLLEEAETTQAIEGIRRGLDSMRKGQGVPAKEVFARLEAKYPFLTQK